MEDILSFSCYLSSFRQICHRLNKCIPKLASIFAIPFWSRCTAQRTFNVCALLYTIFTRQEHLGRVINAPALVLSVEMSSCLMAGKGGRSSNMKFSLRAAKIDFSFEQPLLSTEVSFPVVFSKSSDMLL